MPIRANNMLVATPEEAAQGAAGCTGYVLRAFLDGHHSVHHFHCLLMGIVDGPGVPDVLEQHERAFTWNEVHGPWLDRFPDDLVRKIADLRPEQWDDMGRRWWAMLWEDDEESVRNDMLADGPYALIREEIGEVVHLAQLTIKEGKGLYGEVPAC